MTSQLYMPKHSATYLFEEHLISTIKHYIRWVVEREIQEVLFSLHHHCLYKCRNRVSQKPAFYPTSTIDQITTKSTNSTKPNLALDSLLSYGSRNYIRKRNIKKNSWGCKDRAWLLGLEASEDALRRPEHSCKHKRGYRCRWDWRGAGEASSKRWLG